MPVNLTNISPSSVGAYAACSMKLVFDSTFGRPFESSMYADFGTVCHFFTQFKLGLNPRKEPGDDVLQSARRLPEFLGQTEDVFFNAVDACAERAIAALPPLPKDIFWIAEYEAADKSLLPTRLSRSSGQVKGFGGDIDLLRSDRVKLIDLKFVSKIPTKCKVEYLWQMGSYHLVTGVPQTMLLFVTRDAKYSAHISMDWSFPKMAELAQSMRRAIGRMGHDDFEKYAAPVEGDQCGFCDHKARCPVMALPTVNHHMKESKVKPVDHMTFFNKLAAASKPML